MAIFCVIFFLSGASALIFETLWFQLAGLAFGNSVWASSIVLASFMGGLALGNGLAAFYGHRVKSPVRLYATLEVAISVCGLSLILLFPGLTRLLIPLFRVFLHHPLILDALRLLIAFVSMFLPATAMGTTLPLLVKALCRKKNDFGRALGALYGWNTLGAMTGVIVNELLLVKYFGIRGAGLTAACCNIIAALVAFSLSQNVGKASCDKLENSTRKSFSIRAKRLLGTAFFSGAALLALEVLWFRLLILFFVAHSLNFAIMLTIVLGGISLGSLFAGRWIGKRERGQDFLESALLANGVLVVLLYTYFSIPLEILHESGELLNLTLVSLFMMLPVSFMSGVIFTMTGKALQIELKDEGMASGVLALANTLGAMSGALCAGLIMIGAMGLEKSFFVIACVYGFAAAMVFERKRVVHIGKIALSPTIASLLLICLALFPFGLMNRRLLAFPCLYYTENLGERRVAVREGLTETVQYLQKDILGKPYYHRLMTNAHSMSSTSMRSRRYMQLFVYLPVAMCPMPKSALLICFGCGCTAKALTETKSLESIVIVDISHDIVEMGEIASGAGQNPANDPRVEVVIEDGRFFLLSTRRKFDLITAEPPPPSNSGIVNLYTREYFQLIYDHLNDRGAVSYWLPVKQLEICDTKSILKAFSEVFTHNSLWTGSGYDWMMVGVKNPGKRPAESDFTLQWRDERIDRELEELGLSSPQLLGSLFIADGQRLSRWIANFPPLVDNYPRRISFGPGSPEIHMSLYNAFMNPALCRANFMTSEEIAHFWPETLRIESKKYFAVRQTIDELLGVQVYPKNPAASLHNCLNDPLLSKYLLWVFDSDLKAQRIVSKAKGKELSPEVCRHLAARAACKRDYLAAENYLRLTGGFYYYRMYFLFLAGKKEKARQLGLRYINSQKRGKKQREQKIAAYWNWLVKTLE